MFKQYLRIWQIFFDNLTLPLYSRTFYQNVYINFKGYGLKHLFTCCFLASIINTTWLYSNCDHLLNYLKYNKQNVYSNFLDAIFNKLPELEYDGTKLSSQAFDNNTTFYITNQLDSKEINLISINLNDKSNNTTAKINLTKTKILFNLPNFGVFDVPYTMMTTTPITFDGNRLKQITTNYVENIHHLFLYKFLPGIFIFNFYNTIIGNLFLAILAGIMVKFAYKKPIQRGIRVISFAASSLPVLKAILQPFVYFASLADYYSIITIFLATSAVALTERNRII